MNANRAVYILALVIVAGFGFAAGTVAEGLSHPNPIPSDYQLPTR